jgi:hypothetical protein
VKKIFMHRSGKDKNTFEGDLIRDGNNWKWEVTLIEGDTTRNKPTISGKIIRTITLSKNELRALVQAYISDPENRITL